jgi:ribosomal protein L11 methyltransferase
VELDHDSIGNAQENVDVNGERDRVEVIEGDATIILPLLAPVRLVLANIISSVLIQMLPVIRDALGAGGQAILSGILKEERDAMLAALEAGGWSVQREDTEDAWWSVQIALR